MGVTNFSLPLLYLGIQMVESSFNGSYEQFGGKMLAYNMTSDIEKPVYYVLKRDEALYIITRGSTDINDYATDLEFSETTNNYGTFHAGFYNASQYVYSAAKQYISESTTPIYFLGHSYGASVSTILTKISMQDFPSKDINCLAFAPVPCMSIETNATCGPNIASFYNNHDIVPTLSVPNVYERVKWAFNLKFSKEQIKAVLKAILEGIEVLADPFSQAIYQSLMNSIPTLVDLIFEYNDKKDLKIRYMPGVAYHVYHKKTVQKLTDNMFDAQEELNALSIHFSSFSDHLPDNYFAAIHNIVAI